MARLPADYRHVLELIVVEKLSLTEAAARMERSYDAVRKLHGRALVQFTEAFDQLIATSHD